MSALIDTIRAGRFWDFPGGVHPPERKRLSNQTPIAQLPLADTLYIPVKQHIGVDGRIRVKEGDTVLKGEPLTQAMSPFAVPVHAPTSGTITGIGQHVAAHPSGLTDLTIELTPDGRDQWRELSPMTDYLKRPKAEVVEAICHAGVSGLGGAGFPTHIKVSPKRNVEFLIINGVECEPYITSDDMLMREHAWQIRQGIDVLTHLLEPEYVLIAVEDNKPEALKAMKVACQENANYIVCNVPTKYPAGGEKQLIQVLTGREVPSKGLPIDSGVIMQNVGTCYAVADAIFSGKPLIQRVVSVTGEALSAPQNVWALLGTPVRHLLAEAGYQAERQRQRNWIMGGPMMGFNLIDPDVPVVKITNCVLAPEDDVMPQLEDEQPCIRCSACADACPASLLPQQLFWHSKAKEHDKAQEYNLFDCIECGACAYVCPSEIPLVHYYRVAKAEIRVQEEEKEKADHARDRFEARKERLEREKEEREARHRRAAEARRQAKQTQNTQDSSKAAVERAKARHEQPSQQDDTKAGVAAAIARAKAKKAQQQEAKEHAPSQSDKVKAAVERAKAKRLAQGEARDDNTPSSSEDTGVNKQDKVKAAVARAKAKQAEKQADASDSASADEPTATKSDATPQSKQDKVKAAVARAKAKQAEKAPLGDKTPASPKAAQSTSSSGSGQSKQDKIKSAVARAKAKQAQKASTNADTPQAESADDTSTSTRTKQEKIKAAVAKAKAKQQANAQKDDSST